jgi:hypothetical protein
MVKKWIRIWLEFTFRKVLLFVLSLGTTNCFCYYTVFYQLGQKISRLARSLNLGHCDIDV